MTVTQPEPSDEVDAAVDQLGDFFTPDEATALRQFARIEDLLTDEERALLATDLREIAACRRRGLEAAANWQMP